MSYNYFNDKACALSTNKRCDCLKSTTYRAWARSSAIAAFYRAIALGGMTTPKAMARVRSASRLIRRLGYLPLGRVGGA
jgi:hypothetical protein